MPATEKRARLNALLEGLSPRDAEILDGAVAIILGAVKINGSIGLLALVVAAAHVMTELREAVVRSAIGEAVLAFSEELPEVAP